MRFRFRCLDFEFPLLFKSYIESWLTWRGLNVSFVAVINSGDNSQLNLVVKVVETKNETRGNGHKAFSSSSANASDFAILLIPSFTNGRGGSVKSQNPTLLQGQSTGLRNILLRAIQGQAFRLPQTPVQLDLFFVNLQNLQNLQN